MVSFCCCIALHRYTTVGFDIVRDQRSKEILWNKQSEKEDSGRYQPVGNKKTKERLPFTSP